MVLQKLTDSINNTARTVRNTLSLVLLTGLYLGLTLVFSTDENLLRDSHVALPQVGVGISLSASYIVAPVIFLYLHFHLLFLLDELKRKIQAFRQAIKDLDAKDEKDLDAKDEYWNWLSSSAFVQSFRLCPKRSRSSKVLVWLSVVALPLILLFAVFLSFVRYQSDSITCLHRIVFFLDLAFIVWFRSECFACIQDRLGALAKKVCPTFRKEHPKKTETDGNSMKVNYNSGPEISSDECISSYKKCNSKILNCAMKCVVVWIVPIFMILLVCETNSPDVDEDRDRIWRQDDDRNINLFDAAKLALSTVPLFGDGKYIDTVMCEAWDLCRYLDISIALPDVHGIDLNNRELRFARFGSAKMNRTNFGNADLRGAYLVAGKLQGADFRNAKLQEADLSNANLKDADLGRAKLQGANLRNAKLHGADLSGAEFQDTNLDKVQLQDARLVSANLEGENLADVKLQNANLRFAKLQGVNFEGAQLEGADLKNAKLQAANLTEAKLQGARLQGAELQGANLEDAQLQGADIGGAQLQGSFGQPGSLYLAWMPNVSFNFPTPHRTHAKDYVQKLLRDTKLKTKINNNLTWRVNVSLGEHIDEYIMKGVDLGVFDSTNPDKTDMIFHTHTNKKWPPSINLESEEFEKYQKAWVGWTINFTCKNQYTALSSLQRWGSRVPLYNELPINAEKIANLQKNIRDDLVKIRKGICVRTCFGLHAVPADEWEEFFDDLP